MRAVLCAIATSALLSACGGLPATGAPSATGGTSAPSVSSLQLTALKAGIDVEQTFNTAVTAERAAKASGFLNGANAVKADGYVTQAYAVLKVIRPAIDAGATPDLTTFAALVGDIVSITQKGF